MSGRKTAARSGAAVRAARAGKVEPEKVTEHRALMLGWPPHARAMHAGPDRDVCPCHRVVFFRDRPRQHLGHTGYSQAHDHETIYSETAKRMESSSCGHGFLLLQSTYTTPSCHARASCSTVVLVHGAWPGNRHASRGVLAKKTPGSHRQAPRREHLSQATRLSLLTQGPVAFRPSLTRGLARTESVSLLTCYSINILMSYHAK